MVEVGAIGGRRTCIRKKKEVVGRVGMLFFFDWDLPHAFLELSPLPISPPLPAVFLFFLSFLPRTCVLWQGRGREEGVVLHDVSMCVRKQEERDTVSPFWGFWRFG